MACFTVTCLLLRGNWIPFSKLHLLFHMTFTIVYTGLRNCVAFTQNKYLLIEIIYNCYCKQKLIIFRSLNWDLLGCVKFTLILCTMAYDCQIFSFFIESWI